MSPVGSPSSSAAGNQAPTSYDQCLSLLEPDGSQGLVEATRVISVSPEQRSDDPLEGDEDASGAAVDRFDPPTNDDTQPTHPTRALSGQDESAQPLQDTLGTISLLPPTHDTGSSSNNSTTAHSSSRHRQRAALTPVVPRGTHDFQRWSGSNARSNVALSTRNKSSTPSSAALPNLPVTRPSTDLLDLATALSLSPEKQQDAPLDKKAQVLPASSSSKRLAAHHERSTQHAARATTIDSLRTGSHRESTTTQFTPFSPTTMTVAANHDPDTTNNPLNRISTGFRERHRSLSLRPKLSRSRTATNGLRQSLSSMDSKSPSSTSVSWSLPGVVVQIDNATRFEPAGSSWGNGTVGGTTDSPPRRSRDAMELAPNAERSYAAALDLQPPLLESTGPSVTPAATMPTVASTTSRTTSTSHHRHSTSTTPHIRSTKALSRVLPPLPPLMPKTLLRPRSTTGFPSAAAKLIPPMLPSRSATSHQSNPASTTTTFAQPCTVKNPPPKSPHHPRSSLGQQDDKGTHPTPPPVPSSTPFSSVHHQPTPHRVQQGTPTIPSSLNVRKLAAYTTTTTARRQQKAESVKGTSVAQPTATASSAMGNRMSSSYGTPMTLFTSASSLHSSGPRFIKRARGVRPASRPSSSSSPAYVPAATRSPTKGKPIRPPPLFESGQQGWRKEQENPTTTIYRSLSPRMINDPEFGRRDAFSNVEVDDDDLSSTIQRNDETTPEHHRTSSEEWDKKLPIPASEIPSHDEKGSTTLAEVVPRNEQAYGSSEPNSVVKGQNALPRSQDSVQQHSRGYRSLSALPLAQRRTSSSGPIVPSSPSTPLLPQSGISAQPTLPSHTSTRPRPAHLNVRPCFPTSMSDCTEPTLNHPITPPTVNSTEWSEEPVELVPESPQLLALEPKSPLGSPSTKLHQTEWQQEPPSSAPSSVTDDQHYIGGSYSTFSSLSSPAGAGAPVESPSLDGGSNNAAAVVEDRGAKKAGHEEDIRSFEAMLRQFDRADKARREAVVKGITALPYWGDPHRLNCS